MIPRVIHTFWTSGDSGGTRELPNDIQANVGSWKVTHPDFQVKVWTLETLKEHAGDAYVSVSDLMEAVRFPAMQSDIIRIALVYHFGGIWSDLKNKSCCPFLYELALGPTFVAEHPPTVERAKTNPFLCNAFFGAGPKEEFLAWCLSEMRALITQRSTKYGVFATTGPGMFGRVLERYLEFNPKWRYLRLPKDEIWGNKLIRTTASYNAGGQHWRDRQNTENMYVD